ncbi:hypothetical protein LEP1GSC192_2065 [Leptospira sp. B5-022]|nr:hypothetical protein LEP1GSC192_2065 [Leptospira sp. B5-022]
MIWEYSAHLDGKFSSLTSSKFSLYSKMHVLFTLYSHLLRLSRS